MNYRFIYFTLFFVLQEISAYCVYNTSQHTAFRVTQLFGNSSATIYSLFERDSLAPGDKGCCPYTTNDCLNTQNRDDLIRLSFYIGPIDGKTTQHTFTLPGGGWINMNGDESQPKYEAFYSDGRPYEPHYYTLKEKLAPRYLHAKGSSTEKNQTSYDSILPSVMDNIRCYWQLDSNGRYNLLCSLIDPIVKEGVDVRANHSNLVRSICSLSEPVKTLADMRLHLQTQMNRIEKERNNLCIQLDRIISEQLEKLLGQDNLQMKRISWEDDSFDIIEKICLHEAVHPIKDHRDIKRRLGPDRRVYGLFVDSLPNEPLVFIHIALLPSMPNSIHSILNAESAINLPENFHCAICYTITTQNAFGNINLGRHLITSAIESLQQEYPQLKTFATLSPIPGFRKWVLNQQANNHIDLPKGIIGWDQPTFISAMEPYLIKFTGWQTLLIEDQMNPIV
ncbi:hypothetical protein G6F16_011573 [Rhizopus arrhizus]|nr:hypothetical protein G6F24_007034 [Rhizopus arrhizus]KAG0782072.1 hypothetical protein G6F21_011309 [Rhizopus arrhizus]KAG0796519.1 hypothetical protein G6F22_004890 [Rhizopus arrhizus]KAG0805932.1 hypothetical protein G6F20_011521 [Rhizopus arrhizus]KAG0822060.1 hypothetical protein G6F19_011587 [Rhizopus arrhizus]